MKSTFTSSARGENLTFPCLARLHNPVQEENMDMVVLFTAVKTGTVVVTKSGSRPIGWSSDTWFPVYDAHIWEILPPGSQVTLTVE
jgi:hypothetical protein